ncbi:transcriptional repressor protein KorB [Treponema primitia ZAS-2]|uniref:Transcriptional repressor protein KorB n=1 Tax=Treponema primitia (strain ATCC BAA-887 / DSM 12427 / ZAS-2) TaxID=545694 RepID=F5YNV3_TREPZ|nr:ParB N-terminal domain-containing protein [Treponema primitia]AEF86472.1 transcriptional repressor protein KorB [Treponema primitia ZAS-2]
MQIPLDDIIVKKRIRKDLGDIAALAESMKRFGQMSPIVLNNKNVLIAGGRRLEAARYLGWRTINAVVMDINDKLSKLEYEVEENLQRRDFTPDEIALASERINRLRNPKFFRRIWNAVVKFFKRLFKIED